MTEVNIDRVGDSYAIDFSAECVEFIDVQEIIEVLFNLYERQGASKTGEEFIVSKVELHGHFKVKG